MIILSRRCGGVALAIALTGASALGALTLGGPGASADTGATCRADYTVSWQTPSNDPPDFGVSVKVTNTAAYPIVGWTVTIAYTAGQEVEPGSPFSAAVTQEGGTVTARPTGRYNAVLAPGASTSWGFHGTYTGTSNPLPAVTCTGPSQGVASAVLSGPLEPLGVNTASWDGDFVAPEIAEYLSEGRIGLIRYPGGSWADEYLWQENTAKGEVMPVDFDAFSAQVNKVTGGQKSVTVNYGSDTPESAAAWVRESLEPGKGVTLWQIGNELYGSWEKDTHPAPHTAASYARYSLDYLKAMKAVDPEAQICYDYAMDGELAPGSGHEGWKEWNSTVLAAGAAYIDCADVHWYPINGIQEKQTTQSIMELIDNIPAAAAQVKATLAEHDPTAYFVVGETNMSQTANEWNEQPVGALFAAANALEWLANGAQSVQWWDVHNYGTPTADFGMFSSGTSGEPAVNTPFPPYYGYVLASRLAVRGATVGTLVVDIPEVYGFHSTLPDGSYAVMLINADTTTAATVGTAALGITGAPSTQYLYDEANPTISTRAFSGTSVSVPAESIVVLTGARGAAPR